MNGWISELEIRDLEASATFPAPNDGKCIECQAKHPAIWKQDIFREKADRLYAKKY